MSNFYLGSDNIAKNLESETLDLEGAPTTLEKAGMKEPDSQNSGKKAKESCKTYHRMVVNH